MRAEMVLKLLQLIMSCVGTIMIHCTFHSRKSNGVILSSWLLVNLFGVCNQWIIFKLIIFLSESLIISLCINIILIVSLSIPFSLHSVKNSYEYLVSCLWHFPFVLNVTNSGRNQVLIPSVSSLHNLSWKK